MYLYLVQHAIAKDKTDDVSRSLSDVGKNELLKMIRFLDSHRVVEVETIFHSGKLRAEQTAILLADSIKPSVGIEKTEGLSPMDDPGIWADRLADMYQDAMLVGHLPHMSRLASLLLTGDSSQEPVYVRNAGILCLNRRPDNHWSVDWLLTPQVLA